MIDGNIVRLIGPPRNQSVQLALSLLQLSFLLTSSPLQICYSGASYQEAVHFHAARALQELLELECISEHTGTIQVSCMQIT